MAQGRDIRLFTVCFTLLAGLGFGCSSARDNYLEGSLADTYDLSFDETRARLYESELSVEYLVDSDEGQKVTLRITLDVRENPLDADTPYSFPDEAAITRGEGFGSSLPELESGEVTFTEYAAEDGAPISGTFDAVFSTTDESRLTLRGGFSTTLEQVAF